MTLENPNESQTFTLEVAPPKGVADIHPDNNKFTFVHDVSNLSDLSIDARTVKLSEESPTEGKTVFFNVPITNLGGAAAKNFRICLYDNDPDTGGKPLFDYTSPPEKLITCLEAGETRTVRLRWDPVKNSDENRVFIKVDTANAIAETDKSNNIAVITIHVRTKANLKPLGIDTRQTDKELAALITHLVARIRNEGETEAKNVSVRFFKGKIQTSETMIGETLIPRIAPGETGETDYVWRLTEEEAHFKYHLTYQVFLRGSTQRLSSVEEK
jgi:subtilase family serine protease